jgi:phosphoglycolate phosphatase
VAQERAGAKFGADFTRDNTVILGDSSSDVETGIKGEARVIGVANGRSTPDELHRTGASFLNTLEVQDLLAVVRPE